MTQSTQAIERTLIIESPQNKVWQALTDPKKLSQWFGQSASFTLEPKSIGHFGWDDHGTFAMRIEHIQPQSYFAWRWMAQKDTPFVKDQTTLVEWHLKALSPNKTELTMKESEFKSPESRSDNVGGWKQELGHLVEYLGE
jgi:uncharacterized protein YndB with AHSA1/START domain